MMQKMPSRSLIALFLFLLQVAQIQGDCTRPLFSDNIILSAESAKDSYADGETAKVKCAIGYVPVDPAVSRSVTCIGTQWTKPVLECKKKPCGHPGEIMNGRYLMPEGIVFGATITAECNPGYEVIGVNSRRCLANGWSGKPLECDPLSKCLKPADIKDVRFEPVKDSYEFGNVVMYSCISSDFSLIGSEEITCYENGTFYPDPPQCLVISCPEPDVLHSEKIGGKPSPPYPYKSFIKYRCDGGYRMSGSDTITCELNEWNPPPPQCDVISCSEPDVPHSEKIDGKPSPPYPYKNIIRYRCDGGYRMSGSDTITCELNGWNPPPPRCNMISCPEPDVPHSEKIGGKLSPPYPYKNFIKYRCDGGYRMSGSDTITCELNGWNPPPPRCNMISCPEPDVLHSEKIGGKLSPPYPYKSFISYRCDGGYRMSGSDTITCELNGWNPPPPRCNMISCSEPDVPHSEKIDGKPSPPYPYKNIIRYRCDGGYRMSGSDTITCELNGWNPPPPRCNIITTTASPSTSPSPTVPPHPHRLIVTLIVVGVLVFIIIGGVLYYRKKKAAQRSFAKVENKTDEPVLPTGQEL